MSTKDEERLESRAILQTAMKSYYKRCNEAGFLFEDDLANIVVEATAGEVKCRAED